jgi:sigma-B regulation protein RsbU (phosphoserine phosphatase)
MTLFYLLFDTKNEVARWGRAGHEPAMIYCPVLDTFTILGGDESCLPLGVEHESRYVEHVNDLHPGQIIAIGTDGIWEARNMDGEMFGKERFKRVVRKYCLEKSQVILDEVFKAVRFFTGGATPEDDITLVVVKYGFDE